MQPETLECSVDRASLSVAPGAGGRLMSWQVDGEPVIHWPAQPDWSRSAHIRGGNPLLFPFADRHCVDGQVGRWRDAAGVVRELAAHGFARHLPFEAQIDADRAGVRMALVDSENTREGYPFQFRFEVHYRLAGECALEVSLTTANTGDVPLPYYAGHHFYFALPHAQRSMTQLELPPTLRRHTRPDRTISAPEPGESSHRLDDARLVDRYHCLLPEQPDPCVKLVAPLQNRIVTLELGGETSIPWYAVTTWTEAADSDFFCIEPWLGLPDAIHNGLGLRWLAPGASETAALRIRVATLG